MISAAQHRSPSRSISALAALLLVAFTSLATLSCGGGGGSSIVSPPPPPTVSNPSITTNLLSYGFTGETYNSTLQASGGTPPYSWAAISGSPGTLLRLPSGLSISGAGVIAGTPIEVGAFAPTFQVTDAGGRTGTKQMSIVVVGPLSITTSAIPDAVTGRSYGAGLNAQGGAAGLSIGNYVWSLSPTSSPLPPGITLNSAGNIGGTPSTVGSSTFTVQVSDVTGRTASANLTLRVANPLAITDITLPIGGIGVPYTQAFSASGGVPPYVWAATSTTIWPNGLTMDPAGILQGTPTASGFYQLSVSLRDSSSPAQVVFAMEPLSILSAFTITKTTLTNGTVTKQYQEALQAAAGLPPFVWTATTALPAGLSLSPSGLITGVPTQTGSFQFDVQVVDSSQTPRQTSAKLNLQVLPQIRFIATTARAAAVGIPYISPLETTGGTPPLTARVTTGSLPPGLSFQTFSSPGSSGVLLSGTPTTSGPFPFVLEVTDSSIPPDTISSPFDIRVDPRLFFNTPPNLPEALVGTPYSYAFVASGGLPPYVWTLNLTSPGLPFTLDSNGNLTGTPTQPYDAGNVYVTVKDSGVQSEFRTMYIRVLDRLVIRTTALPPIKPGQSFAFVPEVTGGVGPYTWRVANGGLPAGLSMTNTSIGEISGAPAGSGVATFTLEVSDSSTTFPQTAQRLLSMTVTSNPGRNDSIATATSLSNGRYRASISPPDLGSTFVSDSDFYRVFGSAGSLVTIETFADRLTPVSPLDTVIEIVDASGIRLNACNVFPQNAMIQACVNDDDFFGTTTDSKIYFQVPGAPGTTTTFYVRVLSWDGHARPDYRYEISISGAN